MTQETAQVNKQYLMANFCFDDLRVLHKEANEVYQENDIAGMATMVSNSKGFGMEFQWVFGTSVVIDGETFLFLSEVFGLVEGRKRLTFADFVKAFQKLTPRKPESIPSDCSHRGRGCGGRGRGRGRTMQSREKIADKAEPTSKDTASNVTMKSNRLVFKFDHFIVIGDQVLYQGWEKFTPSICHLASITRKFGSS